MSVKTSGNSLLEELDVDSLVDQLDLADCEGSLRKFIELSWTILEPNRTFVPNWHIDAICDHLTAVSDGEISRLLISVPPGCMKALPIETPILTSRGWKAHGDLVVGDFIFGGDGCLKKVEAYTAHKPERVFKVSFDDGTSQVAGEGHLWHVLRGKKGESRNMCVVPTTDLIDGLEGEYWLPDAVPLSGPIDLSPQYLLIEPYLLGAWLGDGASNDGVIYSGEVDLHAFRHLGKVKLTKEATGRHKQNFYRIRIPDLRVRLRVLGLLNNKHIPDAYLMGSIKQRQSLLQGLMDTDGMCTSSGHCIFTTKFPHLANQLAQVVASLSMKPHQRETYSVVDGQRFGPYYEVRFTPPHSDTKIFRLPRKQNRVRGAQNSRSRNRYVSSVEYIDTRLVNCIQVEGELYVVGNRFILTHNSLTTDVFWPAWLWGPQNRPDLRFISASYAEQLTVRDNRRCRNIIQSEWYQRLWGDRFFLVSDQNAKVRYETNHRGFKVATSVGGLGTGERGDFFVVDDPHNVQEGESQAKRAAAINWFKEVVPTRVTDPDKSAIVVIMQRVHEYDVSGVILEEELGYEHLMLPMRFEPDRCCSTSIGFTDPREDEGELLWEERMSEVAVDRDEKVLGPYATAAQMQQRPAPRGGGMFQEDWFEIVDVPPANAKRVRGWDLASTEKINAPYTAGVKMSRTPEGIYYIEHVVRCRRSPDKVELALKNTASLDGCDVPISIPQDPGQAGKAQVRYLTSILAGYVVRSSPETGDKVLRAEGLSAQASVGNVKLVRGSWNRPFLDEVTIFPRSKFKDQTDAASRAFSYLVPKTRTQLLAGAPVAVDYAK